MLPEYTKYVVRAAQEVEKDLQKNRPPRHHLNNDEMLRQRRIYALDRIEEHPEAQRFLRQMPLFIFASVSEKGGSWLFDIASALYRAGHADAALILRKDPLLAGPMVAC